MAPLLRLVLAIYRRLEALDDVPRLLARLGIGLMFFGGALHKWGHLADFTAYFESLHIPAARLQAPFVVTVETVGGLALILGAATRPAAAMLAGTMVVALLTAAVPEHSIHADWKGLLDFLFLPEWLLLTLLGWLVFAGAGRFSVDARLRPAVEKSVGERARAKAA